MSTPSGNRDNLRATVDISDTAAATVKADGPDAAIQLSVMEPLLSKESESKASAPVSPETAQYHPAAVASEGGDPDIMRDAQATAGSRSGPDGFEEDNAFQDRSRALSRDTKRTLLKSKSGSKGARHLFGTLTRTASHALGLDSITRKGGHRSQPGATDDNEAMRLAPAQRAALVQRELDVRWSPDKLFFFHPKDGEVVTLGCVLQSYIDDATSDVCVEYRPLACYTKTTPWHWFAPTKRSQVRDAVPMHSVRSTGNGVSLDRLELQVLISARDTKEAKHYEVSLQPNGTISHPSRIEIWLWRTPRLLTFMLWYKEFAHLLMLYLLGLVSCCATIYSFNAREEKFGEAARDPLISSLVFACLVLFLHALQLGSILWSLYNGESLGDILSSSFRKTRELALLPSSLLTTGSVLCNVYILGRLKAYRLVDGIDDVVSAPTSFVSALYASIISYVISLLLTIVDVWLFQSHSSLDFGDAITCVQDTQPYRLVLPWTSLILLCMLRLVQDFSVVNSTTLVALVLTSYALIYLAVVFAYYDARRSDFDAHEECCPLKCANDDSFGMHGLCTAATFTLASSCVCIALGWGALNEPLSFVCLVSMLVLVCPVCCVVGAQCGPGCWKCLTCEDCE